MIPFIVFRVMKIVASLLAVVVIGINLFFVVVFMEELPSHWAIYLAIAIGVLLYMTFVVYLVSLGILEYSTL